MSHSTANLSPEQKRQLLAKLLQAKQPRYPLSFAQQRLWFLEQLQPGLSTYNLPAVFQISGSVQIEVLEQSIRAIINRHETLRTSFVNIEGEPFQQVHSASSLQNKSVLKVTTPQPQAIPGIIHAEATQPFDLTQASLLRATLLQISTNESILLFTLHHLIADYESLRFLIYELTTVYQSIQTGQPLQLPELPIQYTDYAVWQRQWLQTSACTAQLDYWCKQLENPPPLLQLPTDFLRPAAQTFRGARLPFSLSADLSNALKTLSRQAGATLFMTLLAAFQTLLYRYTGQSNITVGSTVANRNRLEVAHLIGLFVNNLVFRTQFADHLSFRDLLLQVRETSLNAYSHQDLPFEYLVEHLQPDRHLSHNPLFQVMFVLHNQSTAEAINLGNLSLRYLEPEVQTARFDLSIDLSETPDGLSGIVEYSTDLFRPDTIERLIRHFQTLLNGITQNPDQRLSELPLLTTAELQQFSQWNHRAALPSRFSNRLPNLCCHHLIEQQAERTPDAIAVIYDNHHLSYRELNHRANQLSDFLLQHSITSNIPIAVCLDRCLDIPISLLAIHKAGAAYLPLDPALPAERLSFMLSDSQAQLILTHSSISLPPTAPYRLNLDILNLSSSIHSAAVRLSAHGEAHPPIHPPTLHTPAYLLYTSGSTGIPKGVQISHRSLVNFLLSMQQYPGLVANDVLLAVTTLSFDIAALELWLPLSVGATVVIADRATAAGVALSDALTRHQITIMQATPATWQLLTSTEWCKSLKALCGGEALDATLAAQLLERCSEVWNLYGPTETTIWSGVYRVETNLKTAVAPIGQPIANTEFHVLDAQLQPVPIGVAGELCIGGIGLAQGYLNRPDLTAEKFVPHPQGRLYRTGDRVRYQADGTLEYLGRFDHQIKLRGFRIELGEIAAVLAQHPDVQTAVVILQETPEPHLVAYFAPVLNSSPTPFLRDFLAAKLPSYMLPAVFVPLEAMPLTPNGKIDRRALPIPNDVGVNQLNNALVTPRNSTEIKLVELWANILNRTSIGITDNFFELGGHSLLATRVITQIQQKFGVEIPLRYLFEQPTIAALAEAIHQGNATTVTPIQRLSDSTQIPLSFAQQRQWFLAQLEPDSPFYNIPAAVRVAGKLDVAILQQCFEQVLQRHQVLRTDFHTVDGQPIAQLRSTWNLPLPLIDLSQLPAAAQTQQVKQLAQQEAQCPFAVNQSPLLRIKLLRLAPAEAVLLLTLHHLVADGWSIGVLLKEIVTLYAALRQGKPALLPELPIQYSDFAGWQRSQTELLETQLTYWQQQLQDAPALLELPTRPRHAVQHWQGNSHSFELSASITQTLKHLSQQHRCTLFMTLLAAFQTLLARYSSSTDILIGSPIANRNQPELESLIGCFANTLVFRTNLSGNPSFNELLTRVKKVALDAYTHQDLPFEQLVDALNLKRSLSYTPIFQVLFLFQPISLQPITLDGLHWSSLEIDRQTAKFDLTLSIQETADGLSAVLEYRRDLFETEMIQRMAGHLKTLLEGIVINPAQRLSELPLLTLAEQHQLQQWNHTQQPYPAALIHHLFQAQVNRSPDAIALTWQNHHLSYSHLNAKANQLAHYLHTLGAGAETRIGICLPRTPDLVIAILATLKAGAAYVPLDPNYPAERLKWIADDADIAVLITQSKLQNILENNQVTINLDQNQDAIANCSVDDVVNATTPANLAYLIYTSGSTGVPKGVAIEHRSTVALLHWVQLTFHPDQLASVLASTSVCFDLSVFEIFAPLSCGGSVVLIDNILQLPTLALAHHLSLVNTVPSAIPALLQHDAIAAGVATLNLAGEALSAALVQQVYTHSSVEHLYNLYGPSEDTTYSTYSFISRSSHPTIGCPITNTQAYILDAYLHPVPVGVAGELYLGGAGLARGYYNRADLTAERFIPNPFAPASRLYRTGDRARYRSDGSIQYLGRVDHQVKLRGFRIELGEIEAILSQHPAVQQAIVTVSSAPSLPTQLIAYIASHSPAPSLPTQLRTYLQAKLPDYMIPTRIILREALSLTPNGKIDRARLTAMVPSVQISDASEAPRKPVEQTLCAIWQQVLGREAIGIHDNFFELGGDSILVIQMIAKASQDGLHFTPKQVFQHQTIAALALAVNPTRSTLATQGILTGAVPLTPIQHWFFEQNFAEMHHWNQAILLEVQQSIRPDWLEEAIQQLLNHHDSLRLRFQHTETGWQQEYAEAVTAAPLSWIDLSHLCECQQTQTIESITAILQTSLDLLTTPLQIAFFDLGNQSGRLLLIIHHLLVDGVSWRILLGDLQTLYQQLSQSRMPQLPLKTTAFRQWAEALSTYVPNSQELSYWKTHDLDASLPLDSTGSNLIADLETLSAALSIDETNSLLHKSSAAYQTQINDLLLTALVQAFSNWTQNSTLLIELESHGREDLFADIDLSRTVGWFTTLYPVRLDLSQAKTTAAALKAIKEQLRAIPQHGISYGILRYLCPDSYRNLQNRPKPQIRFNYLGQIDQTLAESTLFSLAPEAIGHFRSPQSERDVLLEINAIIRAGQLRLDWSYSHAIYHDHTIAALAEQHIIALRHLIQHCLSPDTGGYTPSDFPLMEIDQTELDELLAEL